MADPANGEKKDYFLSMLKVNSTTSFCNNSNNKNNILNPSSIAIITMSLGDAFIKNNPPIRDILLGDEVPILLSKDENCSILEELIKRLLVSFRAEGDFRVFEYILRHSGLIDASITEHSSYSSQCLPMIMIELSNFLYNTINSTIIDIVSKFSILFPAPTAISLYHVILEKKYHRLFHVLFTENLKDPPAVLIMIEKTILVNALLSGKIDYPKGFLILKRRYPSI